MAVVNNNNNNGNSNYNMDLDEGTSSSGSSDDDVDNDADNKLRINVQQNGSMSSFENHVEDVDFTTPNVVYATESIVDDEPPIKQCQKGNVNIEVKGRFL